MVAGMIGKLGIIGAGSVGTAVAIAVAARGAARSIVLYDLDQARAEAEADDLAHGAPFVDPVRVTGGSDPRLLAGCDLLVLAAGRKQRIGQSRLDLAADNVSLCHQALPPALEQAPDALVLVVTNPVDVVTYYAAHIDGVAGPGRVFGSGTVLDTARLRVALGAELGLAVANVHASIVGEHGDSELALWSSATAGGMPLRSWLAATGRDDAFLDRMLTDVRGAAGRIIAGKGATSTAIGFSAARIVEAIGRDERAVLNVSTLHHTDGVGQVCLSLPTVVGRHGAGPVVPVPLDQAETAALQASAAAIRSVIDAVAQPSPTGQPSTHSPASS